MLELVRFQAIEETEYTVITKEGKVDDAVRAFKKIYLEVVHRIIDYLESEESANVRR